MQKKHIKPQDTLFSTSELYDLNNMLGFSYIIQEPKLLLSMTLLGYTPPLLYLKCLAALLLTNSSSSYKIHTAVQSPPLLWLSFPL